MRVQLRAAGLPIYLMFTSFPDLLFCVLLLLWGVRAALTCCGGPDESSTRLWVLSFFLRLFVGMNAWPGVPDGMGSDMHFFGA